MKFYSVLLCLTIYGSATVSAQPLPGCIEPPWNNEIAHLVVNAIEAFRPLLVTGVPSLGIPPFDPMGPLPNIIFSMANEALTLDGSVNETMVRNLAQFVVCQMNVTLGVRQEIYIEFRLDNFHMDGVYDIDGLAVSLFPIFGNGNYTLDTYQAGFSGYGKVTYNVLQDTISISDLALDVFFEQLDLYLECILGCGDMADFVNNYIDEIGEAIFNAVWDYIGPTLSQGVENLINDALKNVSVGEILGNDTNRVNVAEASKPIPIAEKTAKEMGNANDYMDMVFRIASRKIVKAGLDPAILPTINLALEYPEEGSIVNGTFIGLSTGVRSGTCTVDLVTDWIFLYANAAVGKLEAHYPGTVTDGSGTTETFSATISLDVVDIYITARGDTYSGILDIDQFVISELGPLNVELTGLGALGWMTETLVNLLSNIFLDDVQRLLSNELKDAIQTALNENPWPNP